MVGIDGLRIGLHGGIVENLLVVEARKWRNREKKSLAPDVSEAEEPEAGTTYKRTTRPFNPADADGRV